MEMVAIGIPPLPTPPRHTRERRSDLSAVTSELRGSVACTCILFISRVETIQQFSSLVHKAIEEKERRYKFLSAQVT